MSDSNSLLSSTRANVFSLTGNSKKQQIMQQQNSQQLLAIVHNTCT